MSVRLGADQAVFQTGEGGVQAVAYTAIQKIYQKSWMVGWADVLVSIGTRTFEAKRLSTKDAQHLQQELVRRVSDAVANSISTHSESIGHFSNAVDVLLAAPFYVSDRDRRKWLEAYVEPASGERKILLALLEHPFLDLGRVEPGVREKAATIRSFVRQRPPSVLGRNNKFVDAELKKYAHFFDRVEKLPLSIEQRRAAVVMEDRNLLVAPAGSGKTSALVGKIGYALKSGYCSPSDILVVAFNRSAAEELRERIKERLSGFEDIDKIQVDTFHSLGQGIIAAATGMVPTLAKTADDDAARGKLFQEIFDQKVASDLWYRANYILFRAVYSMPASNPAGFETVEAWERYLRANGQTAGGKTGFRTLKGELVKSQGELAIANWLFVHGIEYEYERPYEYETADQQYRQYQPDFYFPALDLYLEHYALDTHGQPPAAFGPKYKESMDWKRALHEAKQTVCLETTFDEFVRGVLFEKLDREFIKRGVEVKLRADSDLLEQIQREAAGGSPLAGLMSAVAKHAKSNLMTEQQIRDAAGRHPSIARAKLFVSLLVPVMSEYEQRLRAAGEIDFEDMIGLAIGHLNAKSLSNPLKLVLVDEFQDISVARGRLVRTILEQNESAKLFAVGDDWQAIYRFAGADISLFWDFEEFFGPTEKLFLTQTFRFNQGISDLSARFVSQNPDQLQKGVKSANPRREKVVATFLAESDEDERAVFFSILRTLAQARQSDQPPIKVFVLARYNRILRRVENWLNGFFSPNVIIEFLTIHRSKGLEADYVILLGLNSRPFGFPSTLDDDPLLQMVMPRPEAFAYAEERRLLYVALTRTKNVFYSISNARAPSDFVKELAAEWKASGELYLRYSGTNGGENGQVHWCPKCSTGVVVVRQSQYGEFQGCSMFPDCVFKRKSTTQGTFGE